MKTAAEEPILHTDEPLADGHYFFTPWPRGAAGYDLDVLHTEELAGNLLTVLTARECRENRNGQHDHGPLARRWCTACQISW